MTGQDLPLGRKTEYVGTYSPDLLRVIARQGQRKALGMDWPVLFYGFDLWNLYEISWLAPTGKPQVAMGTLCVPCESTNIVESKSLKLYLNALNNTIFESMEAVHQCILRDLSQVIDHDITLHLVPLLASCRVIRPVFEGVCLDDLSIETQQYTPRSAFLISKAGTFIKETVYSDLFRANCPVTGQPDWASIQITYEGPAIEHAGLLQYIISYRNHRGFHENCVERFFIDIVRSCKPRMLRVYARFTRRGGIDINPYRSTEPSLPPGNNRMVRQ